MNKSVIFLALASLFGSSVLSAHPVLDGMQATGEQAIKVACESPKAAVALAAGTIAGLYLQKPIRKATHSTLRWADNNKKFLAGVLAGGALASAGFYAWAQAQPKSVTEFVQLGLDKVLNQVPSSEAITDVASSFATSATQSVKSGASRLYSMIATR